MTAVPIADANGIQVCYETYGTPTDPTLLLVMGLGAQMVAWDEDWCTAFVDRGFHVVRFDNRDIGESTWIETDLDLGAAVMAAFGGDASAAPYLLGDMAADAIGLLDALGVGRAHVMGASMGGMIAQTMAIEHPDRVATLTSIMSTTGERDVGQPDPEILGSLIAERPTEREASIEFAVGVSKAISSPTLWDEGRARARATREVDRGINPRGVPQQMLAIVASGSRAEGLAELDLPTLVVHGALDRLVTPSGGERTAELVPGAELVVFPEMAHDVPQPYVPEVLDRVTALAGKAG